MRLPWLLGLLVGTLGSLNACTPRRLAPISLEISGGSPRAAGSSVFTFGIRADNAGTPRLLLQDDFLILYENKMHAFIFDESLTDYQHLHPTDPTNSGVWSMNVELPRDGKYSLWIEGAAKGLDQSEFILAGKDFEVSGGTAARTVPTTLAEVSEASDGTSRARIRWYGTPAAGASISFRVSFDRTDGSVPEIGTYLGTTLHATGARLGGGDLLHVHGLDILEDGKPVVYMDATFSQAGDYRIWVQYVDANVIRTIPFAVHAN